MIRGRSESGVALVFMIMVWLVVLFAVALARSGLSAHGTRNVARLGLGGTAVEVARSALEEAFAVAQRRSNMPGDPMFMALRGEAAGGERRWSMDTPAVRAALGSDAAWRDFELVSGQVELAQRSERRLADDPSARELRFELTARARHRPTGVVRELSTDRACQLRLLTVPRPFDSVSIVILDPGRLLEGVNDAMANALGEMSELTQVVLPQALTSLEEKGRPDLAGRLRGLDLPPLPALDAPDSPYRFLPARPVLYSRDPLVPDLAGIDLAGTIARQREAIDALRGAYFAALNRLIDAGAGTERVEVLIDDWASSIQALHRANFGVIETVKSYTDRLWPIGEPATEVVRKQASALAEGSWRERATYRFEGPGAAQNFIRFLDRYERAPGGQGPSGIALVENRDGPVLSLIGRRLTGKLIVVATGDLDARDLRIARAGQDLVTLQASGRLRLAGEVHASIIAGRGARFECAADTRIRGSLVLCGPVEPAQLRGSLDAAGARHASGDGERPAPEWLHALWTPWPERTRIERQ